MNHGGALTTEWAGAIAAWGTYARAQAMAATSVRTRSEHLRHFARRVGVGPWEVTAALLLEFVAAQEWSQETRRGRRMTFRAFYAWAVEEGHMATSPALKLPRVKPTPPAPRPAPDSVYLPALAAAEPRERLMFRLAAEHGLRRAEVAVVHSRDLIEDLDGWTLVVHGKGGRTRLVPLLDDVAAELRALPRGWAFPGADDGHLSPRWVGKLLNRLLADDWTMHKLRHRAATHWHEESNGDVFVVQDLLGHASPTTTRAYVLVRNDKHRATVNAAARRKRASRVA